MNELVSERERESVCVCVCVWMCWAIWVGVVGGIEMCAFGGLKVCVCVCVCVNEHAGVEGVLPIRTHLPLARPSFSLVLSGKPHYMQVSLAIRERKHKLGSGMQGFLHESERERECERERERWWVGGGEKRREAEDKGGVWAFLY